MKDEINHHYKSKKNNILRKYLFFIKNLLVLLCITITNENIRNIIIYNSEIKLVIIGRGEQRILNNAYYLEPSQVIVNGISRDSCKKTCEFESEENNVSLYFNVTVKSCEKMFSKYIL